MGNIIPESKIPKSKSGFLRQPAVRAVFAALAPGGVTRIVGGAVRNTLMGLPVDDIDLATDIGPETVMKLASAAGMKAIPTGIDHGTVTILHGTQAIEVTTLRRDVETFGRQARVAFTEDWMEDAKRRDFTMNALYCDLSGQIYDPLGAREDITNGLVRFVGNAGERIKEDSLRILRFFRFNADYGKAPVDPAGLKACIALQDGVQSLSRARIRGELFKLLLAKRSGKILRLMANIGLLRRLLPTGRQFARLDRLGAFEAARGKTGDPLLRLAALYGGHVPVAGIKAIVELSRKEVRRLEQLSSSLNVFRAPEDLTAARVMLYRLKRAGYLDAVTLMWVRSRAGTANAKWLEFFDLPSRWSVPVFPLSGKDVSALGVAPGPQMGSILDAVELEWINAGFPDDRTFLTSRLNRAVTALSA